MRNIICCLFGHNPVWLLNPHRVSYIYCDRCKEQIKGTEIQPIKSHRIVNH